MYQAYNPDDVATEDVPLHERRGRQSGDSATSSDLDHLISDDISLASSTDLPPIDGGRGAWTCLLGCWLVEAMIWGFPLAFGVFQSYYSGHELFRESSSSIPTIGTLATGISYLGMPFTNPIALRWRNWRRAMGVTGWVMCLLGLLGASFATQVWHVVVCQGLLYGLGWVVCYTPLLFMLNEWFVERRGLAYGLLFGASGVSGMVIPVVVGWMLERFGFRVALRVYAVAVVVISGPGLLLIRPRPASAQHVPGGMAKEGGSALRALRTYAGNAHFIMMATAVFMQGLGFFIPNIYIATYAEGLGLSSQTASGLLALISLSQVLGQVWQGWISDRVNIYIPLAVSALLPGLGALLLWGPAKGLVKLAGFVVLWGLFSASYSVLYTRICTFLTMEHDGGYADEGTAMLLYGFFSFERGVSNILEGPMSSWLIGDGTPVDGNRYGLGRYAAVIWFTVFCMLASSLVGIGRLWTPAPGRISGG